MHTMAHSIYKTYQIPPYIYLKHLLQCYHMPLGGLVHGHWMQGYICVFHGALGLHSATLFGFDLALKLYLLQTACITQDRSCQDPSSVSGSSTGRNGM